MKEGDLEIDLLVHDTVKIINNKTKEIIYLDPFKLPPKAEKADVILISHSHYDHCSEEDIKKIIKENTKIIASTDCKDKLKESETEKHFLIPNEHLIFKTLKIETINAYNENKEYHPKEKNWLGYIIELEGKRIYFAGDTDLIPEMNLIEKIDVAFLPVSGTYVMTAKEAANATSIIMPKKVVPMHYGEIIGTKEMAEEFKRKVYEELEGVEVEILR